MRLYNFNKAVGCKWVFKVKEDSYGKLIFKARLVAKGYSQREGIDYNETFAPVIKYQSLRMLLAIANQTGMVVHQMDVSTTFLNGFLEWRSIYRRAMKLRRI